MQMVKHAAFRERLLYYLAKDYSQMLDEGDNFTKLQPVTVVCFINDILCRETQDFHSHYEMIDPNTKLRFSSHWAIHVIELPKFKKTANELANGLDRWSYFLRHGEEFDITNLPADLDAPRSDPPWEFLKSCRSTKKNECNTKLGLIFNALNLATFPPPAKRVAKRVS